MVCDTGSLAVRGVCRPERIEAKSGTLQSMRASQKTLEYTLFPHVRAILTKSPSSGENAYSHWREVYAAIEASRCVGRQFDARTISWTLDDCYKIFFNKSRAASIKGISPFIHNTPRLLNCSFQSSGSSAKEPLGSLPLRWFIS